MNLAGKLLATGRSYADNATYVLATNEVGAQSFATLYKWPDTTGVSTTGQTSTISGSLQAAAFGATPQGIFYALAIQSMAGDGTFLNVQPSTVGPPVFTNNTVSPVVDTGLSDGDRAYVLSDGSVMLITFLAANAPQQQLHYPAGSVSSSASRPLSTAQVFPFGFRRNGANVDVAIAVPLPDSTFQLFTATKTEPELFTFNVPADMKQLTGLGTLGGAASKPCGSFYPGKLALLLPTNAGFDFAIIEIATGKVAFYLTGAANLLHANASILDCAVSAPQIVGATTTYDVIWTERVAGVGQNVVYAPLQCAPQ